MDEKKAGKGIMDIAKGVGGEIARGAKLTKLKAEIEKLKRVDLQNAYKELGRKVFEKKAQSDQLEPLYKEIAELQTKVDEKRKGVHADGGASITDKAKAVGVSAKMKAEAEALNLKLNNKMSELGKQAYDSVKDNADFSNESANVAGKLTQLSSLEEEYKILDETASSVAASGKLGILFKNPIALFGVVAVIGIIIVFSMFSSSGGSDISKFIVSEDSPDLNYFKEQIKEKEPTIVHYEKQVNSLKEDNKMFLSWYESHADDNFPVDMTEKMYDKWSIDAGEHLKRDFSTFSPSQKKGVVDCVNRLIEDAQYNLDIHNESKKQLLHKIAVKTGEEEIQTVDDARLFFNAETSNEYMSTPPIDGPSKKDQYYSWSGTLVKKNGDTYFVMDIGYDKFTTMLNEAFNQDDNPFNLNRFAFTDIEEKFGELKDGGKVHVVGRYKKNIEKEWAEVDVIFPLLVDCYIQ